MSITFSDFQGVWAIEREIEDRKAGETGIFSGTAVFSPTDSGMEYRETGRLVVAGRPPLKAERAYIWKKGKTGVSVCFEDGRDFHEFSLQDDTPMATHDCAPDFYRVQYDFSGWPVWRSTWHVTGPRKDYVMASVFRR